MIIGAHAILYSRDADADRDFLRDILGFGHVDVGHGWLIFALPPAEVAVHPTDGKPAHELYLMCDSITKFRADMKRKKVRTEKPSKQRWGILTSLKLPSGAGLGVYQPLHPSPKHAAPKRSARRG